ncbi:endonuclease [Lysobacteraceae bacterium NML120232]|nr:endonuclease [Xanthomonadaceae bacterium NML120232]
MSFRPLFLAASSVLLLAACVRVYLHGTPAAAADEPPTMRFASYNTSLYHDQAGGLIARLENDDEAARKIAAVLQRMRPDVVLLNEFDFDPAGRAADLFQRRYLEKPQFGLDPIHYPYRHLAPVNTGVASGLDLDGDGKIESHGRAYGNDAWGYGLHPGQYGMLVLSRYPIDRARIRSFQYFKWSALPGALRPLDPATGKPWHPDGIWQALRLSSKSHWDVPIQTPRGEVHLLALHPTPPVFDGPEDRNGARNHDEIRLMAEYISAKPLPWLCDDLGQCGGLPANAAFVIVGDLNADPVDGDSKPGAIAQLLEHPRVLHYPAPRSPGAAARAAHYGIPRRGDTAVHTGDFGPRSGTLRLDYVLPSRQLAVKQSGVFWPLPESAEAAFAGGSDHHLVWLDLDLPKQ